MVHLKVQGLGQLSNPSSSPASPCQCNPVHNPIDNIPPPQEGGGILSMTIQSSDYVDMIAGFHSLWHCGLPSSYDHMAGIETINMEVT